AREAAQPALAPVHAAGVPRLRRGLLVARAEPVVLPALVVPAPLPRLGSRDRRRLPACACAAAEVGRCERRLRARVRRARRRAVRGPRSRAGLRTSLAARGAAAPMRKTLLVGMLAALALPGTAFAHASVRATQPSYRERM